jgi:hypothetical protein
MSVAWTTIAIILALLPGVFFFIGMATYERLSREIIRSSVVSELALATMIAIGMHVVAISILSATGFRLSSFLAPLAEYPDAKPAQLLKPIASRLLPAAIYLLSLGVVGFFLGCLVAIGVLKGPLRFLAMHKWVYDVLDAGRKGGIVTAYVMTSLVEDGKTLMYRGRVHELFLTNDGKIAYVILKNCARFYMIFGQDGPTTSKQLKLFDAAEEGRRWDYLFIEGDNIANILFEPSREKLRETTEGAEALQRELDKRHQEFRDRLRRTALEIQNMQANRPQSPSGPVRRSGSDAL